MRTGKLAVWLGIVAAAPLFLWIAPLVLPGCGNGSESPAPQGDIIRSAVLSGSQETPPVATAGSGVGIVSLNPATRSLSAIVITSGVDNVTEVHLHVGAPGEPIGDIVVGLVRLDNNANVWAAQDNGAAADNVVSLFTQGRLNFNVHTTRNSAGEVRGQVLSQAATILTATLSAAQEVPPPAGGSLASGTGAFGLNTDNTARKLLAGAVTIVGADTATEVHLHAGAPGTNGESTVIDNLVRVPGTGIWTVHDNTVVQDNTAALFLTGGLYVHVHTPANPSGEIRGQISIRPASTFAFP